MIFLKNESTKEFEKGNVLTIQYIPLEKWAHSMVYLEVTTSKEVVPATEDTDPYEEEKVSRLLVFEQASPFEIVEQRPIMGKLDKNGRPHSFKFEYKDIKAPYTIIVSNEETIKKFENWLSSSANTIL